MTVSRNTKFRELAHLFREITKFLSLPFREISRNEISSETLVGAQDIHDELYRTEPDIGNLQYRTEEGRV
jgi:hypothetical protein